MGRISVSPEADAEARSTSELPRQEPSRVVFFGAEEEPDLSGATDVHKALTESNVESINELVVEELRRSSQSGLDATQPDGVAALGQTHDEDDEDGEEIYELDTSDLAEDEEPEEEPGQALFEEPEEDLFEEGSRPLRLERRRRKRRTGSVPGVQDFLAHMQGDKADDAPSRPAASRGKARRPKAPRAKASEASVASRPKASKQARALAAAPIRQQAMERVGQEPAPLVEAREPDVVGALEKKIERLNIEILGLRDLLLQTTAELHRKIDELRALSPGPPRHTAPVEASPVAPSPGEPSPVALLPAATLEAPQSFEDPGQDNPTAPAQVGDPPVYGPFLPDYPLGDVEEPLQVQGLTSPLIFASLFCAVLMMGALGLAWQRGWFSPAVVPPALQAPAVPRLAESKRQHWPDGTLKQVSSWRLGKRHGLWLQYFANGRKKSETRYFQGKRHGLQSYWGEGGRLMAQIQWSHGRRSGVQKTWYRHGTPRSYEYFSKGKRSGPARLWHASGKERCRGGFHKGRPCGPWSFWTPTGKLRLKKLYGSCPGQPNPPPKILSLDRLRGAWRRKPRGAQLLLSGRFRNLSPSALKAIDWRIQLRLHLADGRILQRGEDLDLLKPHKALDRASLPLARLLGRELSRRKPLQPQALRSFARRDQWLPKDAPKARRIELRIWSYAETSKGLFLSHRLFDGEIPLPESRRRFKLVPKDPRLLAGAALPARRPTARKLALAPRRRTSPPRRRTRRRKARRRKSRRRKARRRKTRRVARRRKPPSRRKMEMLSALLTGNSPAPARRAPTGARCGSCVRRLYRATHNASAAQLTRHFERCNQACNQSWLSLKRHFRRWCTSHHRGDASSCAAEFEKTRGISRYQTWLQR